MLSLERGGIEFLSHMGGDEEVVLKFPGESRFGNTGYEFTPSYLSVHSLHLLFK